MYMPLQWPHCCTETCAVQVVAATGAKLAETVFVDDSLRNIKAAKELGSTLPTLTHTSQAEWPA